MPLPAASSSVYFPRFLFREAQSLSNSLEQRPSMIGGEHNFPRHATSASLREMSLQRASSFINVNQVVASVDEEEREERASFDIGMEAKGSCIPARNVGQEPFSWCALRVARFLWALQNLPWTSCISR